MYGGENLCTGNAIYGAVVHFSHQGEAIGRQALDIIEALPYLREN